MTAVHRLPARYPDPLDVPTYPVCPQCKTRLGVLLIRCEGHAFPALASCPTHGSVRPMPSAVANEYPPAVPTFDLSAFDRSGDAWHSLGLDQAKIEPESGCVAVPIPATEAGRG